MRIDAFNLGRFGPFTDVNLDFSQGDHGLHVVYGGNRAGKSSSLRALQAALFGIDARTEDNFVHQYSALRLGMTLRNAAGESMTFVRRKANKNALRDAAGRTPLPVDALQPFLCGVDAEEFKRVFTLNQPRLQTGARQLLDDDADRLAAAIVGAALGVNDLRRVQQRLDQEHVSRDGQVQARCLTLGVEQERRDVGILLEPLHYAFFLALAVDPLEADIPHAVA